MSPDTPDGLTDAQLARIASACDATPTGAVELDGGQVGAVFRVDFDGRAPVAAKVGDTPLDVEGRMLEYLDRHSPLPVPTVLAADSDLLVMEYVDGDGRFDAAAQRASGRLLADLHDVTADSFGFEFETLTGPYWQPNPRTDSWIEFFRDQRLHHFAEAAREEGALPDSYYRRIADLEGRLDDLLVEPEAPSLVHGDFHQANMILEDGRVKAVVDPAVCFAHDEFELAYVDRIDGFGDRFFDEYAARRGVDDGFFETRRHVYAVFHALENVRFFGAEMLDRLDAALDRVEA